MRNWWSGLNFRERIILVIASLVAIVIGLDTLILQPMTSGSVKLDDKIAQAKDDLEWMRLAINRLPAQGTGSKKVTQERIVSYIDKQINRQGLKKNLEQMAPIQENSARLRLSDVEFTKLLSFISAIDGSVSIDEVRLLPTDNAGFVNVSMVISNGADV